MGTSLCESCCLTQQVEYNLLYKAHHLLAHFESHCTFYFLCSFNSSLLTLSNLAGTISGLGRTTAHIYNTVGE